MKIIMTNSLDQLGNLKLDLLNLIPGSQSLFSLLFASQILCQPSLLLLSSELKDQIIR